MGTTWTLPDDLPPGRHHIVMTGRRAAGGLIELVVPVEIGKSGEIVELIGVEQTDGAPPTPTTTPAVTSTPPPTAVPVPSPTPTGDLPATGSDLSRLWWWALVLLAAGTVALISARRRPTDRVRAGTRTR